MLLKKLCNKVLISCSERSSNKECNKFERVWQTISSSEERIHIKRLSSINFDKVSHRRLLYKLEYYGIQTHTLNWIQAFLSDRTQTVVIDGVTSNTVPVTSGVPRFAILSQIYCILYLKSVQNN
jgi:hypothetical protein